MPGDRGVRGAEGRAAGSRSPIPAGSLEAGRFYDAYWERAERSRIESRSRERAALAARILETSGLRSGRLLDVGCGPGYAATHLASLGFEVVGIDVSPRAVAEARERGVDARVVDVTSGELPRERYDAVLALEVLEHVVDPVALLEKLSGRVRPGGRLILSTPNEFHLLRRLSILLGRPGFGGASDPHVRHFDLAGARAMIRRAGLVVRGRFPVPLMPPRWAVIRPAGSLLARAAPGLFAIGCVFAAEPGKGAPP